MYICLPEITEEYDIKWMTGLLFDKMFNEWYAQFVYFAYYFINDAEVCRDIVSDAFEYLWRNYEKIEEATAKTYLYTIIRTRCIDYLRKAKYP